MGLRSVQTSRAKRWGKTSREVEESKDKPAPPQANWKLHLSLTTSSVYARDTWRSSQCLLCELRTLQAQVLEKLEDGIQQEELRAWLLPCDDQVSSTPVTTGASTQPLALCHPSDCTSCFTALNIMQISVQTLLNEEPYWRGIWGNVVPA